MLNFMELIGEAMGIHVPDPYKRLTLMGDIDAIIADSADLIATHGLDPDTVRGAVAKEMSTTVPGPIIRRPSRPAAAAPSSFRRMPARRC